MKKSRSLIFSYTTVTGCPGRRQTGTDKETQVEPSRRNVGATGRTTMNLNGSGETTVPDGNDKRKYVSEGGVVT